MPFWKRRKVIYTWDDNYVPTFEHGIVPNWEPDWTWVVPEDRYIELINVSLSITTAAGIHAIALYYELYSTQHLYFRASILTVVPADTTQNFYLVQSGACPCQRTNFESTIHWLPHKTQLLPGDRLRIFLYGAVSAADLFDGWSIRYNRYDLT